MNRAERRKLRPECRFDNLESRQLLNAHVPHYDSAHVAQVQPVGPKLITGTIYSTYSDTTNPSSPLTGTESFSGSGGTSQGPVAEIGTSLWNYVNINAIKYRENYYAVNETLTFNNGVSLSVSYTGSGVFFNSTSGRWSLTVKGSAIGISGLYYGRNYSFTDKLSGSYANYASTEKIRLSS